MAHELINCPHCRAEKTIRSCAAAETSDDSAHFTFLCEYCGKPTVVHAVAVNPPYEYQRIHDVIYSGKSFKKCGWRVVDSWPKPQFRKESAPRGVPDDIGTLLEQSHEAAAKGGHDLAIMGYQRVLKMAQQTHSPEFKGNLHAWVMSLIDRGQLTADLKAWATRVKLRTEIVGATVLQSEEFAVFALVVLEQIFGTRSRIARYRNGAGG